MHQTHPTSHFEPAASGPQPAGWAAAQAGTALAACLMRMLDEIDYGMLLVSSDGQVLHLNHAARQELDSEHPLQLLGGGLRAQRPQDVAPLHEALVGAQRGLRRLLTLGGGSGVTVSVVPLAGSDGGGDDGQALVLLVLGKRRVCGGLALQGFARSAHLTPAETRVLELLCNGVRPSQIAQEQAVAVSTVRTQIGSIRAKTGADSISALVRMTALLPPLMSVLRGLGPAPAAAGVSAHAALLQAGLHPAAVLAS